MAQIPILCLLETEIGAFAIGRITDQCDLHRLVVFEVSGQGTEVVTGLIHGIAAGRALHLAGTGALRLDETIQKMAWICVAGCHMRSQTFRYWFSMKAYPGTLGSLRVRISLVRHYLT